MNTIQIMNRLFFYIEAHMQEPLSLQSLADESKLSVFQVSRLFDRLVGKSPMAYVRERRLAGSIPQLLRGATVLTVALDWGFEYEQSYIRAFREAYGVTPARFRRQGQAVEITPVPRLEGFTVSAAGIISGPVMLLRRAFEMPGAVKQYNYQDNLLKGAPLLDGLAKQNTGIYTACCRHAGNNYFDHDYLICEKGGAVWGYPAGQWVRFAYSGLYSLNNTGVCRLRLMMALAAENWFRDRGLRWDEAFIETVDLDRSGDGYCEGTFSCFVSPL